tara:strand:- start:1911 stop:2246 length:336 start_codon:yes stop_codon:yes gene_type:complete
MTEEKNKELVENQSEETIDTDDLKEKVLNQGKWLRVIWIALFIFIYALSWYAIILISVVQFLYVLVTDSSNKNLDNVSSGFKRYMSQVIDYLTYVSSEKPFPFSPFPNKEE